MRGLVHGAMRMSRLSRGALRLVIIHGLVGFEDRKLGTVIGVGSVTIVGGFHARFFLFLRLRPALLMAIAIACG